VAVRGQGLGTNRQDYQQVKESRTSILRGTRDSLDAIR
jgi:hypothetical protein